MASPTAGIDFSSHAVDVVLLDEDGRAAHHRFELRGADAFERTRAVREAMPSRGWWRDAGVVAIAIEEPQGGIRSSVAKLKAVQGAVLACLPAEIAVEPMVPARWRVLVGLAGNASKEAVGALALDFLLGPERLPLNQRSVYRMNVAMWPQDAFDALCLALAVRAVVWEAA